MRPPLDARKRLIRIPRTILARFKRSNKHAGNFGKSNAKATTESISHFRILDNIARKKDARKEFALGKDYASEQLCSAAAAAAGAICRSGGTATISGKGGHKWQRGNAAGGCKLASSRDGRWETVVRPRRRCGEMERGSNRKVSA